MKTHPLTEAEHTAAHWDTLCTLLRGAKELADRLDFNPTLDILRANGGAQNALQAVLDCAEYEMGGATLRNRPIALGDDVYMDPGLDSNGTRLRLDKVTAIYIRCSGEISGERYAFFRNGRSSGGAHTPDPDDLARINCCFPVKVPV